MNNQEASLKQPSLNQAPPAERRGFWRSELRRLKNNRAAYLFIAPLALVIGLVLLYPILKAALMSFQYWMVAKPIPEGHPFVGLDNYAAVLDSGYFLKSLGITFLYILVTVVLRFALGMAAAVLLNIPFKGRGLVRALVIIPWAIPEVVTCLVFILMYDYQYGVINDLLLKMNILSNPVAYLGESDTALWAAMFVNVWKGFPFAGIMLLAGLQGIPKSLYEAASIDGASGWRKFVSVTMPSLKPVSVIVFLLLVIWTIKDFGIVYVLTGGGPSRVTEILTIFIYRAGFKSFDFGLASAAGMFLLVISVVFTVLYMKATKAGESA
ncbi:carbohydrate ABC transporter permease [Cohnella thailandensis]|uniref:Sugar ABC transporter permease n=1 Tax=Cohnella thailandensis TaxID=557557 RepID=A0A841T3Z1_9BACL|nr:sugar ABC transporter permease [Cohnella thailandensis]MBB6637719.1 sugar ABC transporter permease [Cohnella thailandensis]MBP1974104.1 multiple sugar transport system permease protein [Cohnella thailandensis]